MSARDHSQLLRGIPGLSGSVAAAKKKEHLNVGARRKHLNNLVMLSPRREKVAELLRWSFGWANHLTFGIIRHLKDGVNERCEQRIVTWARAYAYPDKPRPKWPSLDDVV